MAMYKLMVFGDVHLPYESKDAVKLLFKAMREFKPDYILMMGDILDCFSISSFTKDKRKISLLSEEFEAGNKFLDEMTDCVDSSCQVVYIEGNHEARLKKYVNEKASELSGLVSIEKGLNLSAREILYVPYRNFWQLGKVIYTHDLDYAGAYVANRAVASAQHSIVVGHAHRIGLVVESDLRGRPKLGASFGWLGDVDEIDYAHRLKVLREWSLGFGIGYLDTRTNLTTLYPVPIVDNTCCIEGKTIKA